MAHYGSSLARVIAAVAVILLACHNAAAQTVAVPERKVPGLTVSFGAGLTVQTSWPDVPIAGLSGSVQVPLGKRWFAEGEWRFPATAAQPFVNTDERLDRPYIYRASGQIRHRLGGGGASLLYRFGSGGRMSAYAGGGFTARSKRMTEDFEVSCLPRVAGGCNSFEYNVGPGSLAWDDNTVGPQIVSGIDFSATSFLTAFAAVRIDEDVTPYGGLRVALTRRPKIADGPAVLVTERNGRAQRGRLLSLSTSEALIEQDGRRVAVPLTEVRRIEKTTHRVRNFTLAGALSGYLFGYLSSCGGGDENDCWPEAGLLVAGMGAGTGAIIGWSINRRAARDGRDVLYRAPDPSPVAVQVTPVLSPKRTGVGIAVRW